MIKRRALPAGLGVGVRLRLRNSRSYATLLRGLRVFRFFGLIPALALAAAPGKIACGAGPTGSAVASASSVVGKAANLNGAPMAPGATLFPGDVIRLGEASTAALQFGKSTVLAAPETEFTVQTEGVNLRSGRLQVRAGAMSSLTVLGPYFHVNLLASGGMPSSADIRVSGKHSQVSAIAGVADLTTEEDAPTYHLRAGETATMEPASGYATAAQSGNTPAAGQITRLTPQVEIDRDVQHLVAIESASIFWDDDLRSGPTGRAHVTLNDGSLLNLGSDSSLLILQHDAQAQQTSVDLISGRLRGIVEKLTRPASKFEIHTPLGVAGLVGTDFSLQVGQDFVELIVFEGAVRFTTLDGKAISIPAGMTLRISRAGVATGPQQSTPQEVQMAKDLTDITALPAQPASSAGQRHGFPIIVAIAGAGAAGLGVGVYELTRPKVSNSVP